VAVVGIGVDVVDVARFRAALGRTPALRDRLLTPLECRQRPESWAAGFAAKEALAKALGAPSGLRWHDVVVDRRADGRPVLTATGTVAAALERCGAATSHLSLSHDAGLAVAMVVLEG
jgi:holo-[acyl-carrier protein] synthase